MVFLVHSALSNMSAGTHRNWAASSAAFLSSMYDTGRLCFSTSVCVCVFEEGGGREEGGREGREGGGGGGGGGGRREGGEGGGRRGRRRRKGIDIDSSHNASKCAQ